MAADAVSLTSLSNCAGCAAKLRPGNVHSADGWDEVLLPVIDRYRAHPQTVVSQLTRTLFQQILGRIEGLAWHPRDGEKDPTR